ncbi:hypothetical protein SAMD00019534_113610 [Acytostelium subglobosum LB1]|uniref:hypothetical protein n=1 Tax=Acytostelium subglobosum LB1 TaxID=1410327 RepID=UPI00064483C8|nr:hypothetical protein SAMD00019534_113610 [Acytostelium subglobosum LB1]GAM28185.1 hypothetical protein SAMD00019534_113610 [Acytostelium subglobosum LB1]|eukprot:XP_012748819.1 hypothetical protein SAMD00019534_113610 [Acytostelium subglobosum LB1]
MAFSSWSNNINIYLNDVTFTGVGQEQVDNFIVDVQPYENACPTGQIRPTLTINGGRMINCGSSPYYNVLFNANSTLYMNNFEFIMNTASVLLFAISDNVTVVDTTFQDNTITELVMYVTTLIPNAPVSLINNSFIGNSGLGTDQINGVYMYGGVVTVDNNQFINNINNTVLINLIDSNNVSITRSTFTNNEMYHYPQETALISLFNSKYLVNNCTINNNTALTQIRFLNSSGTLSNVVFGNVNGLEGAAIICETGSITLNNINNHNGLQLLACKQPDGFESCSIHGNFHHTCPKSGGVIAGIVIGTIGGAALLVGISIYIFKRYKRNQYKTLQ